ncbi:MAG: hypothetical protein K1X75_06165 [Leptospirales bacterium]|nr:hypothetical protein [Leptospirales bacterium]
MKLKPLLQLISCLGLLAPLALSAQSLQMEFNLGYQPEFRSDSHSRLMRDTEWDISANGDIVAGRTPTAITPTGRRQLPLALYYVHDLGSAALRLGIQYTLHRFEGEMGNEDLAFGAVSGITYVSSGRQEIQNYRIRQNDWHLGLVLNKLPGGLELEPYISRHSFSEAFTRFQVQSTLISGSSVVSVTNSTIDAERKFHGIAPGLILRLPLAGQRSNKDRVSLLAEFRSMPTVTIASPLEIDRGAGLIGSGSVSNSVFSLSASAIQYNARLAMREYALGIEVESDSLRWHIGYREQRYTRSYANYITLATFTGLRGPAPIGTVYGTTLLPSGDVLGDFAVYGKEQHETLAGIETGISFDIDFK